MQLLDAESLEHLVSLLPVQGGVSSVPVPLVFRAVSSTWSLQN